MSESFYAVLGVEADADDVAVRQAYRDAVKRHHPDVSEDPAAERRFKQLTTARDVLLDPDERARYDRLGHDAYVRRYLRAAVDTDAGGRQEHPARGDRGRAGAATTRATTSGGTARDGSKAGSPGEAPSNGGPGQGSWQDRVAAGRRRHVGATTGQAEGRVVGVDEPWQAASEAYQRSPTASREAAAKADSTTLRNVVAELGPWVFIHVVLLVSAIGTSAFVLSGATEAIHLSLPAYLLGLVLFGLVVGLSVLHLVSTTVS